MRVTSGLLAIASGLALVLGAACGARERAPAPPPLPRHLVLVTIDTLRPDRVGAYGYRAARTPALDGVARDGVRFDRAYATAPITLTSHASLLTGLYPPGHGARHNGMRLARGTPTLAAHLQRHGFATGAFVAAFPLDRRFGLDAGFDVYGDRLPRRVDGRPGVERPGREVVDEAIAWWRGSGEHRRFLWVHLFEPHAPYGDPQAASGRPASDRYDDDVAAADHEVGRLLAALSDSAPATVLVIAGDHGEAFGEHGEVTHSLFVYDTTLRVPLILKGSGLPAGLAVPDAVALIDLAPTVTRLLGVRPLDADGIDLAPAFAGACPAGARPLRGVVRPAARLRLESPARDPRGDVEGDRGAAPRAVRPRVGSGRDSTPAATGERSPRCSVASSGSGPRDRTSRRPAIADALSRLAALGYVQGGAARGGGALPDPKDRRELAARIVHAVSGEVEGPALRTLLEGIVREDPGNGQVRQRLGYVLLEEGRAREAEHHFRAAIDAHVPSADPYLGLAACLGTRGATPEALAVLRRAAAVEPDNPVVLANIGIAEAAGARLDQAASALEAALAVDPDLHEARFALARVYARGGRRDAAARQADELLRRLPSGAPQRPEVERLRAALR